MASQYGPATDDTTIPPHGAADGYRAERVSTNGAEPSVGTLIGSLLTDTNRLVKDEIRLAKAEVSNKVDQARGGVVSLILGGALLLLGLIYLIQSAIYALSLVMAGWLAALIVGGVIALAGFLFLKKGQSDLKAKNLAPTRTQENLQRDAQTYKEATK